MEQNREHPIERIMETAVSRIKTLADADTIIGTPVTTADGTTVIPVSKVSMGFLTGGGEYSAGEGKRVDAFPFAGGSGAGVSVTPIGFLIASGKSFKMISIDGETPYTKALELVPKLIGTLMDKNHPSEKNDKKK